MLYMYYVHNFYLAQYNVPFGAEPESFIRVFPSDYLVYIAM